MRHIVYHEKNTSTVEAKNPSLLTQQDVQAFAVTREYLQAVRTKQYNKVARIREANQDLTGYFNYIDFDYKKNPYYSF